LSLPYGLTFGPDGDLYVTSGNNTVIRYNGTTGALIGTFVTAGSGGLSSPRGLVFLPNGRLLVASFTNNALLQYNGTTGAFIGQFNNGPAMTGPWGVRVGPDGNLYAVRSTGTIRVQSYKADTGLYLRSFVRADPPLISPTGLAFRPGSNSDCNANQVLDVCEPESMDINLFVQEMLAEPQAQSSICLYDQDSNGLLDGRDVPGFVAILLGP
jgi:DNA-binding beta-propeller fold protein YncE